MITSKTLSGKPGVVHYGHDTGRNTRPWAALSSKRPSRDPIGSLNLSQRLPAPRWSVAKEVEDTTTANHAGVLVYGVRATPQGKGSQRRTPDVGELGGGWTRRHGPGHVQALATLN